MFTIEPPRPLSRMAAIACLQPQNVPVRCVATRSCQSSFVVSCRRPSPRMPALLTMKSSAPYSARQRSIAATTSSSCRTSPWRKTASPPSDRRLVDRGLAGLRVSGQGDDARTLGHCEQQDLPSKTPRGAGDDARFAREPHAMSPPRSPAAALRPRRPSRRSGRASRRGAPSGTRRSAACPRPGCPAGWTCSVISAGSTS